MFSQEQNLFRAQARKLLDEHHRNELVLERLEHPGDFDRSLWNRAVDMGWTAITIPEEFGGLGLGALDLCVIAEELGRSAAMVPLAPSLYLAAEALTLWGSEEQRRHYLPFLADGTRIGAFAFCEGQEAGLTENPQTRYEGGCLYGKKLAVLGGVAADLAIVYCAGGTDAAEPCLTLVDLNQEGVEREAAASIDNSRGAARIEFNGAPAECLGAPGAGLERAQVLLERAAIPLAFEQIGGAENCLSRARDYALERVAFGQPIGVFQAIKHRLADMYTYIELARGAAYEAALAWSTGSNDVPLAAASARLGAIKAYDFAARESIHIHGALGVTWETGLHIHYRRARALALELGSAPYWQDRLVHHLEARGGAADPHHSERRGPESAQER